MEVQHFSHEHILTFYEEGEEKLQVTKAPTCVGCNQIIQGPVYFCKICANFWLHKSCIELPSEISHPLHQPHPLTLSKSSNFSDFFICDECRDVSFGFLFTCDVCNFNLDLKCAIRSRTDCDDCRPKGSTDTKTETTCHFTHQHELFNCNSRLELEINCFACDLPLSGAAFGCLRCKFFLHRSCKEMPREIKHPYHQLHPLRAEVTTYDYCDACITPTGRIIYCCSECDYKLDLLCANNALGIRSSLKHKCHEHELYYFLSNDSKDFTQCRVCHKKCTGPCFFCTKCLCTYFHFECIPIPRIVKHEQHYHSLTLVDSFLEDDSGDYYCEVCEKKRDPKYPVYYCEECPNYISFVAHIECVASQVTDEELNVGRTSSGKEEVDNGLVEKPTKLSEVEQNGNIKFPSFSEFCKEVAKPRCKKQVQSTDFSHDHSLRYRDFWEFEFVTCYGCKIRIEGPGYTCEFCKLHFHKVCAELPNKIRHPLHSPHPLALFPPQNPTLFKCNACRNICYDVAGYQCDDCWFRLDIKCASLTEEQCQKLMEKDKVITISHTIHKHVLTLSNCVEQLPDACKACRLPILGSTYCCLDCRFFLHELCIEIPQEVHHPYHPQHPLLARDITSIFPETCSACNLFFQGISYTCDECKFLLHFTCANYLTSTLKYKCHEHDLFCFAACDLDRDRGFIQSKKPHNIECNLDCNACGKYCYDCFYRCVQCDLNLHLECIPIPLKVKQECHLDPLVLYEFLIEDDSGEYYCDICEKPRNPNHDVYYCEECEVLIAHIGCVLYEGDTSLEVLLSWSDDLGSDIGESSGKEDCGTVLDSDPEKQNHEMKDCSGEHLAIVELDEELKLGTSPGD